MGEKEKVIGMCIAPVLEGWHAGISKCLRRNLDIFQFLAWLREEKKFSIQIIVHSDCPILTKARNKKYERMSSGEFRK